MGKHVLQVLLVLGLLGLVAGNLLLSFCEFVTQQGAVCCCDGQAQLQDLALLLQARTREQGAAWRHRCTQDCAVLLCLQQCT